MAASMSSPPEDLLEDDITSCNTCHQLLKNPKTLPCLHSYCTSCLPATSDDKRRCQICSQEFDMPANGVEGLQPLAIVGRLTEQKLTKTKLMSGEAISCTACVELFTHGKWQWCIQRGWERWGKMTIQHIAVGEAINRRERRDER